MSRQKWITFWSAQRLLDVLAVTSLLVFLFVPRWTASDAQHVFAAVVFAGAAPLVYGGIAWLAGRALGAETARFWFTNVFLFVSALFIGDAIWRGLGWPAP